MSSVCSGFHESCSCETCAYVNMLYCELDYLESFEPENIDEINRLTEEIESLGYSC